MKRILTTSAVALLLSTPFGIGCSSDAHTTERAQQAATRSEGAAQRAEAAAGRTEAAAQRAENAAERAERMASKGGY